MHTYFLAAGDHAAIIEFNAAGGDVTYRDAAGASTSLDRATAALYFWRARERGWAIKRWR
jgi:hypothetical protein